MFKATQDTPHGDWKTQAVREEYMGLRKDETCELVNFWSNFYGRWARVKRADGKMCDVNPEHLVRVRPE